MKLFIKKILLCHRNRSDEKLSLNTNYTQRVKKDFIFEKKNYLHL
jgi:hypothetical protein